MLRSLLFFVLFSTGVSAGTPEKQILLLPINAQLNHGGIAQSNPALAQQLHRSATMALSSRGLSIVSEPSSGSTDALETPDTAKIQEVLKHSPADLIFWLGASQDELKSPTGPPEAAFCPGSISDEPVRGAITISVKAFDRQGKLIWASESKENYRCQTPVMEVWAQVLTLLEKAPF